MQLHAACAAPPTVLLLVACASCFLAFGALEGVGATRIPSRTYSSAVLRCEKWRAPEAEPRAPSKRKQRRAARLCMDLHTHSTTLLSRSLSFVATPPPPQPPPDSPLNVALLCLPCLLLSSSCFPYCKRTNNKKSSAFKSARSFLLHCSYSRS
jgi:hypothetical protein